MNIPKVRMPLMSSALSIALAGMAVVSQAATITVTAGAADEVTSNASCSLREAITNINDGATTHPDCAPVGAYGSSDTINLPAGTYATAIVNTNEDANATGDYDVTRSVAILGAGSASTIINGGGLDRVFDIIGAIAVSISGVTITGGDTASDSPLLATYGGCLRNIASTVTIANSTISGCLARTAGSDGGGVFNSGTLTVTDSTISGNSAYYGGAISNSGTLAIAGSTLSGNTATYYGGAIYNVNATLTITNSTITGNLASSGAGGIINYAVSAPSLLTVTNSTIAQNSGIGIWNYSNAYTSTTTLSNSIIAKQTTGSDCAGTITTSGHNLESAASCGFTGSGDVQNADPLLGALANNGGSTQTMALLPGSPAIDVGSCVQSFDQRGTPRPQGSACDIGAYELGGTVLINNVYGAAGGPTASFVSYYSPIQWDVIFPAPYRGIDVAGPVIYIQVTKGTMSSGCSITGYFESALGGAALTAAKSATLVSGGAAPPGGAHNAEWIKYDFAGEVLAIPSGGTVYFRTSTSNCNSAIAMAYLGAATYTTGYKQGAFAWNNEYRVFFVVTDQAVAFSTYYIGGTISGVATGEPVVLVNNSGDPFLGEEEYFFGSGPYAFDIAYSNGTAYSVAVQYSPAGKVCTLINGTGTIALANVTNVDVSCSLLQTTFTGAASRKTHGAQSFDLPLAQPPAAPTVEPRAAGAGDSHRIVLMFDKPVSGANAAVTEGTGTPATPSTSGNEVIVDLTGVTNAQYVTVALTDVVPVDGGAVGSGSVRIGFLVGDVNGNRVVTLSDLLGVNASLAQAVGPSNFLRDVNLSGTLTLADKLLVNSKLTQSLPVP